MSRGLDGGGKGAEAPALPVPERALSRRLDGGGKGAGAPALPVPERV
ncbi:MAG TPA: hypothetical protein VLK53_08095 [Gaiellaceae bacterium]|nr:hypothetical protein [Gaiellaceae bacterium]